MKRFIIGFSGSFVLLATIFVIGLKLATANDVSFRGGPVDNSNSLLLNTAFLILIISVLIPIALGTTGHKVYVKGSIGGIILFYSMVALLIGSLIR